MTIKNCPICNYENVDIFLERLSVPTHQNMLFDEQETARAISRGDLRISICHMCGFVFNAAFSSEEMSYNQNYENTQNYSPMFEEYVNDMVEYLVRQKGVSESRVIEVGCGKGDFLRKLVEKGNNTGIGFDPSYIGPLEDLAGQLTFKREFYNEQYVDLSADFVVCRHVIEHIEDPVLMLSSIRRAVQNSSRVLVFFETPDVDWILENKVVWDFFYEHCSYFSSRSIVVAFEKAGFHVQAVRKIFGGQYLWIEATPVEFQLQKSISTANQTALLAKDFRDTYLKIEQYWKEMLINLKIDRSVVAIWGAGAKGVTFANLFDSNREFINCVVDINPNKQGKYLPGTGHPIISPAELSNMGAISAIILMNPNYRIEIDGMLSALSIYPRQIVEFLPRN